MKYFTALCTRNRAQGGLTEMETYEIGYVTRNGEYVYFIELDTGKEVEMDDQTFQQHFVEEW